MTLAITANALRWLLGGSARVITAAWHPTADGAALVFDDGPGLRVVPVTEWVTADGWVYARGEGGAVWVLEARAETTATTTATATRSEGR